MGNTDIKKLKERLSDRDWRLRNLYYIKDSSGNKILFNPNPVQVRLLDELHNKTVILKARKFGCSTQGALLLLDNALFNRDRTNVFMAHLQSDQTKIFRNMVKYAFDNLPEWVHQLVGDPITETTSELTFKNGSSVSVALNTRSGTPTILWISELAYTSKNFPNRAREIVSGSFNSVAPGGLIVVESTPLGKGGVFYDLCIAAQKLKMKGEKLTELDFKIQFFPWYEHPDYKLEGAEHYRLPPEIEEYFQTLERDEKITISIERKRFYAKKWEQNLRDWSSMHSEFPSTFEESFKVNLEGAFFTKEVNAVYEENRVGFYPYDPRYKVWTAWDIGVSDYTAITFLQMIGNEIRVIDSYQNNDTGSETYMKLLSEKPYIYERHVLPHDIKVTEWGTGATRLETMISLGLTNYVIAPKIGFSDGIDKLRILFKKFTFDKNKAQPVIDALMEYRKRWNDQLGVWSDEAVHDENSHRVDSLRYMAVSYFEHYGEVSSGGYNSKNKNSVDIVSFFK